MPPTLVTGAAGFIGHAVSAALLARGDEVVGVDDLNGYYDPALKRARLARLRARPGFRLVEGDIADADRMAALVRDSRPRLVIHLAAQAGVRHSLEAPFSYERSNLLGHLSVLEACRQAGCVEHLVYASSSSVYGDRPAAGGAFREDEGADTPVSLYAATKRAGELMSASYASLYGLPQTGLRFFTAYGPWGRPDMAYFVFARRIAAGQPIAVFGEGRMARDFTYVDDVVAGVLGAAAHPPHPGGQRVLNVGSGRPVGLGAMIDLLEEALGRRAIRELRPMQPGDVRETWADLSRLRALTGYAPRVTLAEGLARFVRWFRAYEAGEAGAACEAGDAAGAGPS